MDLDLNSPTDTNMSPNRSSAASMIHFERNMDGVSSTSIERSSTLKYKLSHFYKTIVTECSERESR